MSSFKRRVNPTSGSAPLPLPAGVKPSSFSSPVPLVSTGVPALDDLLSGGGLSSGSDLLLLPASGTAAHSAAHTGASTSTPSATAETDHAARALAEPYLDLLLGYSVAQGIASSHANIVIGEDAAGFTSGLMARAGDLDDQFLAQLGPATPPAADAEAPSDSLDTVVDEDDTQTPSSKTPAEGDTTSQREREMKIAWRYHSMKQFNTTVNEPSTSAAGAGAEAQPFCQTFDLSKRIDPRLIQHATAQGRLEAVDVADQLAGESSYDVALHRIAAAADRCRKQQLAAPTLAPPVLRIAVRSLGSPSWTTARGQTAHWETVRFLHRLRHLLRSLALTDATPSSRTVAIPAIAVISISSFLLSGTSSGAPVNLAHRLVHSVDAAVSLSAFASSAALRRAFSAYTGAFKVLKTPAIGTLTNPSIRSSVLRGMGSGAASTGGLAGAGEGGAGGGENNLAFKVRRKRMVIETLHLDVEGGVSERRTKPPKSEAEPKRAAPAPKSRAEDKTAPPKAEAQGAQGAQVVQPTGNAPRLKGLAALRQRGMAAAASAPATGEYAVQVDTAPRSAHSQARPGATPRAPPPLSKASQARPQDLEF